MGCGCGQRRAKIQAMNEEQAAAIVAQQMNVQPLDNSTIVDPDELVHQPH